MWAGSNSAPFLGFSGAGDGTRTRDSLLGKQVLYQLSYPRIAVSGATHSSISLTVGPDPEFDGSAQAVPVRGPPLR